MMLKQFKQEKYIKFFFISFIYMLFVFFSMYTNGLVNQWDGIWEYNYYKAGTWSISLGRWLWPFLDRIKMGLGTEPLSTIFSCALFALGLTIAVFFIYQKKAAPKKILIFSFLFLGSASISVSLSYRFMSATYGFAFLFSILAVFLLAEIKNPILAVIVSGFLIAAQMGLYQAYIGCTGLLMVVWLISLLSNKEVTLKKFGGSVLRSLLALIIGAVLYLAGFKIILRLTHTAPAAYKGMENYSVLNTVLNLGGSIKNAYRVFVRFFFSTDYRTNLFMNYPVLYYVLLSIVVVILIVKLALFIAKLFKENIVKGILGTVLVLLSPAATNIVLLVATNTDTAIQMTVPLALYLPLFFCLFDSRETEGKLKILSYIEVCLLSVFLYGTILQTEVDQEAMRTGMLCVSEMAETMTDDLLETEFYDSEKPVCVIGVPSGNELYYFPKVCTGANHYAMFGTWGAWSDVDSWKGVFHNLVGLNLEFASKQQGAEIKSNPEFTDMPCFPNEGYIKEIDGVMVIKASNGY